MPSRVLPRPPTSASIGQSGTSLVGDPQREAVRRLRLVCLVATVLPTVGLALVFFFAPEGSAMRHARGLTSAMVGSVIALSFVVRHVLGREDLPLGLRLDVGFAYEIAIALLVATVRHTVPWGPGDGFREMSPLALIVVLFAALVPNPPRRTLAVSILAALMEPVGLGISILRGNPVPEPVQIVAICATPLVGAAAATVVSHVLYGLAKSVDAARRMGSYRLVQKLGEGGMGEVWRAEHDLLARPAAIKLIRADGEQKEVELKRFEREAQATAALRSPHTIQLYDFGVADGGTFYYVMELLDGVDLEKLVRQKGPLVPERAIHVLRQICKSLDEAHHHRMVHRDIKPANILVCEYGREHDFVKVLDFSLVKPADPKEAAAFAATVTQPNAVLGTPAYMAPEMVLTGIVDERADIYAIGCVAYWLLTGRLVFDGDSLVKLVVQHVHDKPVPPSEHAPGPIPQQLDQLVLDCLEKDPAKRPQKVGDIERRLADIPLERPWSGRDAELWWRENPIKRSPTPLEMAKTEVSPGPTAG